MTLSGLLWGIVTVLMIPVTIVGCWIALCGIGLLVAVPFVVLDLLGDLLSEVW